MSHKPNLLSWDQEGAASPREFHKTDNYHTNFAALLATGSTFLFVISGFRNFYPTKNYRKLFFPIFKMLCHASKAKEVSRSPENYHWSMMWRHTGSDQSTNVYPRDTPSILVLNYDPLKDRRIDDDSARFKFDSGVILYLNQSQFFAKHNNQSIGFMLYRQ